MKVNLEKVRSNLANAIIVGSSFQNKSYFFSMNAVAFSSVNVLYNILTA